MSNERIDEFLSWRGRLDGPEGVPGQGLDDREASWERLMDRFKEPPRRKRFWGYGIAAACLLLALIPAARLFQDRHGPASRPSPQAVPAAEAHTTAPVVTVPLVHAEPVLSASPEEVTRRIGKKAAVGHRETGIKVAALAESPVVVATSPDSVVANIIAKPMKNKELRIIHINEVSGSAAPSPSVTAAEDYKRFDFSLQPTALKVKLSSSN